MSQSNRKWDPVADADLLICMILDIKSKDSKCNWQSIQSRMQEVGHTGFSVDAISQHWSKALLKKFNERQGKGSLPASSDGGSGSDQNRNAKKAAPRRRNAPSKAAAAGRTKIVKAKQASRKTKLGIQDSLSSGGEDEDDDDDDEPPAKKSHAAPRGTNGQLIKPSVEVVKNEAVKSEPLDYDNDGDDEISFMGYGTSADGRERQRSLTLA